LEAENLPLQSEISKLQSEIEVMNSTKGYEVEIFRGKLAESQQDIETLRTDLAEARRQNTVLVDQSASHQSEIEIMNSTIAYEGHISQAKLAESYQDAETLKTDLNEAKRQNTVLVDQSISHKQAHAELSTKCQSRDRDLEALGHQISAMGEALEEKDEQILIIETEKATIQAHQSSLLTQNQLLEEKLLGLDMIGVLEGKLTALNSALGTIEGNCEDLTKERDYFKERYEVAQRDLDEIDGMNGSEVSSEDVK
jgi:chromosome segregation ATPase